MQHASSDPLQRPFVRERDDSDYEIDDLEDGYRLYGEVEVLGEPVEEEFGPEEAFEGGCYLIYGIDQCCVWVFSRSLGLTDRGREYYQSRPVVLDELAHGVRYALKQ